jgi:hypothetical protein
MMGEDELDRVLCAALAPQPAPPGLHARLAAIPARVPRSPGPAARLEGWRLGLGLGAPVLAAALLLGVWTGARQPGVGIADEGEIELAGLLLGPPELSSFLDGDAP